VKGGRQGNLPVFLFIGGHRMATKKPESRLVRRIIKRLKTEFPGSFWFKHHGGIFSAVGIPDIIGVVNGRAFFLEVKVPGKLKTLSKIQAAVINQLQRAGACAACITSPEEALALVDAFAPAPKSGREIRFRVNSLLARIRAENRQNVDDRRNHSSKRAA
jgi:hypothetical protein